MATLKLNKKNAGPPGSSRSRNADGEKRAPIRGKGLSRPRQSLERAQSERQERQAQYEQQRPHGGPRSEGPRGSHGPHGPQGSHGGDRPARTGRDEGPRFEERRPARRDGAPSGPYAQRGPQGGAGGGNFGRPNERDARGPRGPQSHGGPREQYPQRDGRPSGGGYPSRDDGPRFEDRRPGGYQGQRQDRPYSQGPHRLQGPAQGMGHGGPRGAGGYGQRDERPRFDERRPQHGHQGGYQGQGQGNYGRSPADPRDNRGHWDSRDSRDSRDYRGPADQGGQRRDGNSFNPGPRGDARPAFDPRRDGHRDQRQDQRRASGPRPDDNFRRDGGGGFNQGGQRFEQRPAYGQQRPNPTPRGPSAAERAGQNLPEHLREAAAKLRRQLGDSADDDEDDGDDERILRSDANSEGLRLSKQMGLLGMASRREADEWIAAGWVRVDGKLAVLGQRVSPDAKIEIDQLANKEQAKRVTILINKPIGYVSGQAEDGYENAVTLIKSDNHWAEDPSGIKYHIGHSRGLAPAGRLDIDSTGLLVLTQDGRIAKLLIGEDSIIEKEYLVRVEYHGRDGQSAPAAPAEGAPKVDTSSLLPAADLALLQHGLELDGVKLKPAKVSWQNEDQLRFVLREGRKRQIRRMCEQVGLKVVGLKRVRIGRINLGNLPVGQWRFLTPWEKFD